MLRQSGLWLLLFVPIIGCAMPRQRMIVADRVKPPTAVARAESEHLSELGEAARERKSGSGTSKKEDRRNDHDRDRKPSHCSRCNSSPCTCSSSESVFGNLLGSAALWALSTPFTVPAGMLGDDYSTTAQYPDYPYADGLPGSMIKAVISDREAHDWTGTAQLFNVYETKNIDRFGGRLVLESASRFGIDTETNYWAESGSIGTDHLWTGDANVVFRFAESEHTQFRAGLGVNWLTDHAGTEAGFNFTYGADWFPRKPWTVSTVFDMGTIGGGSLFHNRTTAGVMLGPVEAFAGYDFFQIGSIHFHGPVAGLGWRF